MATENWRLDYNQVRPHSALGNLAPEEYAKRTRVATLAHTKLRLSLVDPALPSDACLFDSNTLRGIGKVLVRSRDPAPSGGWSGW
jgi:hypothetical protein